MIFKISSSSQPIDRSEVSDIATINSTRVALVTDNRRLIPNDWKTLFACRDCAMMMCSHYAWNEIERGNVVIYKIVIDWIDYHNERHAFRPVESSGRKETQRDSQETSRDLGKEATDSTSLQQSPDIHGGAVKRWRTDINDSQL